MIQPRDRPRFMNKPLSACRRIESAGAEKLESNDSIKLLIMRTVDHAHTALADLFQQVVMRYRSPLFFLTRLHATEPSFLLFLRLF